MARGGLSKGDPRLNAVASLKLLRKDSVTTYYYVIHGLMPWPH